MADFTEFRKRLLRNRPPIRIGEHELNMLNDRHYGVLEKLAKLVLLTAESTKLAEELHLRDNRFANQLTDATEAEQSVFELALAWLENNPR